MSIYDKLQTNADLEKKGVEFEPFPGDGVFVLARAGGSNNKWKKALEKKTRQFRGRQASKLDDDQMKAITLEIFIETVLLGWSEVKDRDDKELKYSKTNAKTLFDDLPELFEILMESANNSSFYLREVQQSQAKNSQAS